MKINVSSVTFENVEFFTRHNVYSNEDELRIVLTKEEFEACRALGLKALAWAPIPGFREAGFDPLYSIRVRIKPNEPEEKIYECIKDNVEVTFDVHTSKYFNTKTLYFGLADIVYHKEEQS